MIPEWTMLILYEMALFQRASFSTLTDIFPQHDAS